MGSAATYHSTEVASFIHYHFKNQSVKKGQKNDVFLSTFVFLVLRLGLSEINPIYIDGLKKSFEIPGTCGLVGGKAVN